MVRRKKLAVRRRPEGDPKSNGDEDEINEGDRVDVEDDDCEAIVDDPGDDILVETEENEVEDEVWDEQENEVGDERCGEQGGEERIEEEQCTVLPIQFADINEEAESDDSGDDDLWNEDNIPDPLSSDDEEEDARREAREDEVSADEILALGKTFATASDFKKALLRYSLKTKYDIKLYLSNKKKLGAVCSDKEYDCKWRVYCAYEKRKHKLQIKVFVNEHICFRSGYSKMLKISSIAELYSERLRVNPKLKALEIASEIKRIYKLNVTEDQCRKAKTKVTRERRAGHIAHFSRIFDYEAAVLLNNQGTSMEIQTIPGATPRHMQRFDRIYICFEAQRTSWKETCRPIIGLDGAFLKWDVKGHLLAAVGRDGDNRIVPIAWAVVEIENDDNWAWFVNHIKRDLGLRDGSNFTIISDKQKGLVKAVHNELPQAEHRMCARHILGNWKRDSHDPELERLFWRIARSYTVGDFTEHMEALRSYNQHAYQTLQVTNPNTWSRAFFKVGSCCNDNLNNLCESFNKTIREARRKPLLDMLEDIRRQCMVRTAKRSIVADRLKTRFTKRAHSAIDLAIKKAQDCTRYMATGDVHEIDYFGCSYTVKMEQKTCGCGMWQLNGIPCHHAACVITAQKRKVDEYVSDYYTTLTWRRTYQHSIQPVEGMKLWPRLNRLPVLPPPNRLGNPGRPSNYARRKSRGEASSRDKTRLSREKRVMTCSNCREEGHNKVSCSKPYVEPQAKRPRGRPRKDHQDGSQEGSQRGSQRMSQGGSQRDTQV